MTTEERNIVYAFARVEAWLEEYAGKVGMRARDLIEAVAFELQGGHAVSRPAGETESALEERRRRMDRERKREIRRHRKGIKSPRTLALNAKGMNAHGQPLKGGYWAKMSPLQRRREMRRRIEKRQTKRQTAMPAGGVA